MNQVHRKILGVRGALVRWSLREKLDAQHILTEVFSIATNQQHLSRYNDGYLNEQIYSVLPLNYLTGRLRKDER